MAAGTGRSQPDRPERSGRVATWTTPCAECGAPLPEGGTCLDHFHALLLLEWEVAADPAEAAGDRGAVAHFLAVSTYALQHPEGMGYTAEALAGARRNVADLLDGRASLAQLRTRVRRNADGPVRDTRRDGDEVVRRPVAAWPRTVADALAGGVAGYNERVASWAGSILQALDAAGA